jgi:hypothetical protein
LQSRYVLASKEMFEGDILRIAEAQILCMTKSVGVVKR